MNRVVSFRVNPDKRCLFSDIIQVEDDYEETADYLVDYNRATISSARQSQLITLAKRIGYTGSVFIVKIQQ